MSDKLIERLVIIVTIIMFIGVVSWWPVSSYFEAKAYQNLTGKNVSIWEAMFLELRITNE